MKRRVISVYVQDQVRCVRYIYIYICTHIYIHINTFTYTHLGYRRERGKLMNSFTLFITEVSIAVLMKISYLTYIYKNFINRNSIRDVCVIKRSESVVNEVVSIISAPVLKGFTLCAIHEAVSAGGNNEKTKFL